MARRLLGALLALQAGLLAHSATVHSYTRDESAHLAAGVSYWQLGRFGLYPVNPPLVKLVAAIPVVLSNPKVDWGEYAQSPGSRPDWRIGERFVERNGAKSLDFLELARWACLPFSLLGTIVCYVWARDLYGEWAGVLAAGLWALNPSVLGHGHLITMDVPSGSMGCLACYCFWKWTRVPRWRNVAIWGAALGAAEITKTIWVVLFPLLPATWLIYRLSRILKAPAEMPRNEPLMIASGLLLGLCIVNAAYLFEGTGTRLGDYQFVSATLGGPPDTGKTVNSPRNRFVGTWMSHVSIPLPQSYVAGIDRQKYDFEQPHPCFIGGTWYSSGRSWCYAYALLVKEPIAVLVFACLATLSPFLGVRSLAWRVDEMVVLAPLVSVWLLIASQSNMTDHTRYLLSGYPFMFVGMSRLCPGQLDGRFAGRLLVWGLAAWSGVSSLSQYPHGLSYFNEIAGGPTRGVDHLLGSNLDWGQDLLMLKSWMDEHPEARPLAADVESTNPTARACGIDIVDMPETLKAGWYVLSINQAFSYFGENREFMRFRPVDRIGYTMYVYRLSGDDVSSVK